VDTFGSRQARSRGRDRLSRPTSRGSDAEMRGGDLEASPMQRQDVLRCHGSATPSPMQPKNVQSSQCNRPTPLAKPMRERVMFTCNCGFGFHPNAIKLVVRRSNPLPLPEPDIGGAFSSQPGANFRLDLHTPVCRKQRAALSSMPGCESGVTMRTLRSASYWVSASAKENVRNAWRSVFSAALASAHVGLSGTFTTGTRATHILVSRS
jgi:hypothetical protein